MQFGKLWRFTALRPGVIPSGVAHWAASDSRLTRLSAWCNLAHERRACDTAQRRYMAGPRPRLSRLQPRVTWNARITLQAEVPGECCSPWSWKPSGRVLACAHFLISIEMQMLCHAARRHGECSADQLLARPHPQEGHVACEFAARPVVE
jgi:hypothetical protein